VTKPLSDADHELLASCKAGMLAAPLPPYDLNELYADRLFRDLVGKIITRSPRRPW
jgi:hypothetical protein